MTKISIDRLGSDNFWDYVCVITYFCRFDTQILAPCIIIGVEAFGKLEESFLLASYMHKGNNKKSKEKRKIKLEVLQICRESLQKGFTIIPTFTFHRKEIKIIGSTS